jgi:hypothetical protein
MPICKANAAADLALGSFSVQGEVYSRDVLVGQRLDGPDGEFY